MKNIVKFFREKYKLLIPIMVVLVLLITIFFLYKEYKYDNTRNKVDFKDYQYFNSVRVDYTVTLTYNLKDVIVDVKSKNKVVDFNKIPIYYKDKSVVLFPCEMNIVFPLRGGSQFKLYKYASYYNTDSVHFINNNTEVGTYEDFFLYNGKDLFFFPVETVIKIDGKEYKKLGPMSYASVVGGYTLVYYDPSTEEAGAVELNGKKVTVSGMNIDIKLNEKYFYSYNNKLLLMSPNILNPVLKTIDKQ